MAPPHDPLRRAVITALASLPLIGTAGLHAETSKVRTTGSRILVAYFSRSGNTQVIAGLIQRELNADLFEIAPATAYPEDYLQTVEQARKERDNGFEPELASRAVSISSYHTLFLGFPIWGGTAPPVIRAFLSAHDLAEKTLIPFITHGGYGLGNSHAVLASHGPGARLLDGFSMQADQERKTMEQVTQWLSDVAVKQ